MTIETVVVQDLLNPVELQQWFDSHSSITTSEAKIILQGNIFYVIY